MAVSVEEDFHRALHACEQHPGDFIAKKSLLDMVAASQLHRPWEVVSEGYYCIFNYAAALGDRVWSLTEQVAISALELGDLSKAKTCVEMLARKFRRSIRVRKLLGLAHEASGEQKEAMQGYEKILESNPVDMDVMKRKVVLAGLESNDEAIIGLNRYLGFYPLDLEAWVMLSELFVASNDLHSAKFAMEEVIMLQPQNYAVYLRYAEILFALDSKKLALLARQCFAQAVELHPTCLRALFGIITAAKNTSDGKKISDWAQKRIKEIYSNCKNQNHMILLLSSD